MEELSGTGGRSAPFKANAQILLVEDSETMRLFLKIMLQQLLPNCQINEASDGREALRSLSSTRVDLVVTDLQMPGMDGQSLVHSLRRTSVLRKKPILVISAALDEEVRRELAAFGSEGMAYLNKPFAPKELQDALESLLRCA
jgi:CheY-like chemotaxis protein